MVAASVMGLQADKDLYNKVVKAYNAGNVNELLRLMMEQYNWTHLSHKYEASLTYQQSRRMTILYITLIKIANAVANKGEYNLRDTRTNEVIGHRGWYISDYIFKDIIQKALPHIADSNELFRKSTQCQYLSPEYGVVQSIITGPDLRKWQDMYNAGKFVHTDSTQESFFADAQQVFRNIASGRSIVLLTNDTLKALTDFMNVFGDKENPAYKPEYTQAIDQTKQIVKQDIQEYNQAILHLQQQQEGNR